MSVKFDRVAGTLLLLLGGVVMAGWSLQSGAVVRVLPHYPPMVFNTALLFAFAGGALLMPSSSATWHARVTAMVGGVLVIVAALVLAENLSQFNLGIDWRSLHAWLGDDNPTPGRMPPGVATAFLMSGVVLILAPRARRPWVGTAVRILTLGVGSIAVLGLAGYLVSARLLFPQYWFAGVALHTTAGLLLLAVGLRSVWGRFAWSRKPLFEREDDRITFVGASVLAAIALSAGVATFAVLQGRVQTLVRDNLLAELTRRADIFQDLIELRESNARIAATRPAVLRNLRVIRAGRDDGSNIENVNAVVESFVKQGFSAMAYLDADGRVVARGGSFVQAPAISVTLATPEKAELLWNTGFVLQHRVPMHDAAGKVGEVFAEQPLPALTRLAQRPPGKGETWDMGLCTRRGQELLCFPQRLNPRAFSAPTINMAGDLLPMTSALLGETGTTITRDYRAQSVVAAYGPVGGLGLGMVVKVDAVEIFQPIREQLQLALGLLLLLVVGGTLLLRSRVRPLATRLVDAEERFRAVSDTASDAIISADGQGNMVYFNRAAQRGFGYSESEVLGQPLTLLMPERFKEAHRLGLQRFISTGQARIIGKTLELEARRKDGAEFPMEISLASWATAKGTFFTAILRDITDRKRAETRLKELNMELDLRVKARTAELHAALEDLRKSERHYRMLFEANPHPMWVYDVETLQFLAVNDAAVEHYGYTKEEFLHMTILRLRPVEDREMIRTVIGSLDSRKAHRGVYRHLKKDGREIYVEVVSDGIDFEGKAARLVLAHDISERRRAEEEIQRLNADLEERVRRRTAELEAVNRELEAFSYSVSHDLRAPLRHINGFADLLKEESLSALNETARRYLEIIRDSVKQMGKLIDDLLVFSKMGRVDLRHEQISMAELVKEALGEVGRSEGNREIDWEIGSLPAVRGDRATLKQVWVNLLSNAVKYSRQRSVAKIQVGCTNSGAEVEFYVRDNGAGFDMKYADKLFGVFQRLHRQEEFEGTGVGLANVRRIVTRHGGRTWAEARLDEGASFYFTLPNLREGDS
jgi:hypothetical protein